MIIQENFVLKPVSLSSPFFDHKFHTKNPELSIRSNVPEYDLHMTVPILYLTLLKETKYFTFYWRYFTLKLHVLFNQSHKRYFEVTCTHFSALLKYNKSFILCLSRHILPILQIFMIHEILMKSKSLGFKSAWECEAPQAKNLSM